MSDSVLTKLRQQNPDLRIISVYDSDFAHYGKILKPEFLDEQELFNSLNRISIPDTGNVYVASAPELEHINISSVLERQVFGMSKLQVGYCNGNGSKLNALEYHKCSEVNYSTTGLVLLLARAEQLENNALDSSCVIGCYLPPRVLIEVYPMVLHFAPCKISCTGFNCLVALTHGTNEAIERHSDDGLLWMQNKWLLCHPDSAQAKLGAFVGISGKNIELMGV